MTENSNPESKDQRLDALIRHSNSSLLRLVHFVSNQVGDAYLGRCFANLQRDFVSAIKSVPSVSSLELNETDFDKASSGEPHRIESQSRQSESNSANSKNRHREIIRTSISDTQKRMRSIELSIEAVDKKLAVPFEQIRGRLMIIERATMTTLVSRHNLNDANLYVLIDGRNGDQTELSGLIQNLVRGGVDFIQLRDKSMTDRELVDAGRMIGAICRDSNTRFIMNDRADLALASNADGVHLGQDDLRVDEARRILGAARSIGVSTHSLEQAQQAVVDGANYIGVGPVFESKTKSFDSHVGLDLIQTIASEITLPAFAIGGINHDNVLQVCQKGISRVAVSAAVAGTDDPESASKRFKELLSGKTEN
jgi:thiamine-phosphate pyrophosphorylase